MQGQKITDRLAEQGVSLGELRELAIAIAGQAAERIRVRRAELSQVAKLREFTMAKSSAVDPVTIVDTMAEEFIAEELSRLRPSDGLIGEEGSDRVSVTGLSWIVDPIDGTVNFLYGQPRYAVSIAVAYDGMVIAGAVANVVTEEVYFAQLGGGAFRRCGIHPPVALHANAETDPAQGLVGTGFSYLAPRRHQQAQVLLGLLPQVRDIRRQGSAALDLCSVAEGTLDAFYEHGLNCWDYAAGALIAAEAGAVVELPPLSVSGSEFYRVSAVCEPMAEAFVKLLAECGGDKQLPKPKTSMS